MIKTKSREMARSPDWKQSTHKWKERESI